MAIKDLEQILRQVHEPDEYSLVPENMNHTLYWIWKLENGKLKDLDNNLRNYKVKASLVNFVYFVYFVYVNVNINNSIGLDQ